MARWQVHQSDANAAAIYRAAKKLGFSVHLIGRPVDALLCLYGQTAAVEVKTADGKFRPDQLKFFKNCKGLVRVVRTESDVLALYRFMRDRHDTEIGKATRKQRSPDPTTLTSGQ